MNADSKMSQTSRQWLEVIFRSRIHADLSLSFIDNGIKLSVPGQPNIIFIFTADHNEITDNQPIFFISNTDETRAAAGVATVMFTGINISQLLVENLCRGEESTSNVADAHDRFPASASATYQSRTIERPLVDECFEAIRQIVARQWPQLALIKYEPKNFVTCDVDNPYEFYTLNQRAFIKKLGGDLLKRKSYEEFRRTWRNYWRTVRGDYSADPNNTFDWMMDVNERAGNKMAFYFLVDQSVPTFDAHYSIDEPRMRQLMRRIYDRGHEIGLHASYGTYKAPKQMKKEADKLRQVMAEEGIKQDEIGSRQHYIRWSTPETARHLEAAGIAYDTTLGYADHAGFRCGTSHEFPMFDVENQKMLNLRQRPLIMMEASILSPKYMNMGYSDATLEYMKSLKDKCFAHGGNFTLLWHNSFLKSEKDKVFYQELINA